MNPPILSFPFLLVPTRSFLYDIHVSGTGKAAQEFLELFCAVSVDTKSKSSLEKIGAPENWQSD